MSPGMPSTVAGVVRRLQTIEASAPPSDGVVCFARLYRQVTQGVDAELARKTFANALFLERLDLCFAGLFFSALEAYQRDPATRAVGVDAVVCAAVAPWSRSASIRPGGDERAYQP